MPQEPKVDSVQSALSDLMNLEEERIDKEDNERKAREEQERKRREEQERKRKEEEALKAREQEQARLAKIKAEQDEMERKQREKEMQELELKKKMDMESRLKEEELRMKHEEQMRAIEAKEKKGFPIWGWVVIGVVILGIAGGAIGTIIHQQKKAQLEKERIERDNAAMLAAEKADKEEQQRKINALLDQISGMKAESDMTADELKKKKELEELLATLTDGAAAGSKKKKKKKTTTSGTPGKKGDDYKDPLGGI